MSGFVRKNAFQWAVAVGALALCAGLFFAAYALAEVPMPAIASGLTYNGSAQEGVSEAEGYTLSGQVDATNAGEYTVTATLREGRHWPDGSTEPKRVTWEIDKASLDVSAFTVDSTFTGEEQSLVSTQEVPEGVSVSYGVNGVESERPTATNAGSYEVTMTVDGGGNYKDATIVCEAKIAPAPIAAPEPVSGLVADGKTSQVGVPEGDGYTVEDGSAVEPGEYVAVVTPDANHVWEDGSSAPLQIAWSVGASEVPWGNLVTLNYDSAVDLPVSLSAYGVLVATADGTVVAQKNPYTRCEIASTTKLLTCWLASEYLDDDSQVSLSSYDTQIAEPFDTPENQPWHTASAAKIEAQCMLTSSNPYAHALARYVARARYGASGTDWGDMTNALRAMDERASEIGMSNTTFVSPSGLFGPGNGVFTSGFSSSSGGMKNNQSTANDMMLLTLNAAAADAPISGQKLGSNDFTCIKTGTNERESMLAKANVNGETYYIVLLAADHTSATGGTDVREIDHIIDWLETR